MVEPASPTAGVGIRRDYALNTAVTVAPKCLASCTLAAGLGSPGTTYWRPHRRARDGAPRLAATLHLAKRNRIAGPAAARRTSPTRSRW